MKRIILVGVLATSWILAACGGIIETDEANRAETEEFKTYAGHNSFTPEAGEYNVTKYRSPSTPHECVMGDGDAVEVGHYLELEVTTDKTFILHHMIVDPDFGTFEMLAQDCEFRGPGRSFTCTFPEQYILGEWFGMDAETILASETWLGVFTDVDKFKYTVAHPAEFTCTGTQCDLFGTMLWGPDFTFPCGKTPYGMYYAK